jgi:hypothetical protein
MTESQELSLTSPFSPLGSLPPIPKKEQDYILEKTSGGWNSSIMNQQLFQKRNFPQIGSK